MCRFLGLDIYFIADGHAVVADGLHMPQAIRSFFDLVTSSQISEDQCRTGPFWRLISGDNDLAGKQAPLVFWASIGKVDVSVDR